MMKAELIAAVARHAEVTNVSAARAIDCVTDTITKELKKVGG